VNVRRANFAGTWYPSAAAACEREIKRFLKDQAPPTAAGIRPNGGIVPHAGWYFSGSIACNVIHRFSSEKPPDLFVLFGMHLHEGSPSYIMVEGAWDTPFGPIEIEEDFAKKLTERFSFHIETPHDYIQDNTIELQLPFIKYFCGTSRIVPVGVPPAGRAVSVGEVAAEIAMTLGKDIRFIGSTDLTHYGYNYGFAPMGVGTDAMEWVRDKNDRRIIDAMLALDPERVIAEALASHNACCAGAVAAAIAGAKVMGTKQAQLLAYATSYDKSPGDNLVGYVGILF